MLQYGHTVNSEFMNDNTISDSVKEMARDQLSIVEKHDHNGQTNEENAQIMLRGLHRKDVTNVDRTSLTPSITEMHVVKSAWLSINGK